MSFSTVVDLDALTSDTISTCVNDVRLHNFFAGTTFSNKFKRCVGHYPHHSSSFVEQHLFFANYRDVSQLCGGVTIYTTVNVSLTERGKEGTQGGLGRGSQFRRIIFINPKQIFVITGD